MAEGDAGQRAESTHEQLTKRLDAVERALTGTDQPVTTLTDEAAAADEREALTDRLDAVETQLESLEAATQALRGYAGAVSAVNREVERRADLALARATAAAGHDEPIESVSEATTADESDPSDGASALAVALERTRREETTATSDIRVGINERASTEADANTRDLGGLVEQIHDAG